MCEESCNWYSGQGFRTSGLISICNTDVLNAFDKSFSVCTLGSPSAEGGWAVNLAVFLSWTIWEMTLSDYELSITWHKMVLSLLFTDGVILCKEVYTSHVKLVLDLVLIKAEISCISAKTILAASWSWLLISPWDKLIACRRLMIWT